MRLPSKKVFLINLFFSYFSLSYGSEDKRLTKYANANPLAPESKVYDWPRFNGPFDNATTLENGLSTESGKK